MDIPERTDAEITAARAANLARLDGDGPWNGPLLMENYERVAARLQRELGHAWFTVDYSGTASRHPLRETRAARRLDGEGVTTWRSADGTRAGIGIQDEDWLTDVDTRPLADGEPWHDAVPVISIDPGRLVKIAYSRMLASASSGRWLVSTDRDEVRFRIEDHYPCARDAPDLAALMAVAARDVKELAATARVMPEWLQDNPEAAASIAASVAVIQEALAAFPGAAAEGEGA